MLFCHRIKILCTRLTDCQGFQFGSMVGTGNITPHTHFHICYQCDHTCLAWVMVSRLWPLKEKCYRSKKTKKTPPQLTPVLKSQFHSGSSIALTRSGWQQEFVSPPNLEITFSAARRVPASFPFPFCLSPCNPASLALYCEVTSQDPLTV